MCYGVLILLVLSVFLNLVLWWKLMDAKLEIELSEESQGKLSRIKIIIEED